MHAVGFYVCTMTRLALTSIFLAAAILFGGHLALLFSELYEMRLLLLHMLLVVNLGATTYLCCRFCLQLADQCIDKGWRPRKGWWLDPVLLALTALRHIVHQPYLDSGPEASPLLECSWLGNFVTLLPIAESWGWTVLTWGVIAHNLWHLTLYLRYRYRTRGPRLL